MKKILFALALLLAPAVAQAANCSGYSYTLTNGQTADASQVMSNFNTILSCANTNLANAPSGVNSNITSFTQGVSFGSTLGVTGATTLSGNTTVGGTLGVTGATTLTGGLTSPNWVLNAGNSLYIYDAGSNALGFRSGTAGTPKYASLDATGTFNILNGGLFVQNNSSMSGTLGVSGIITANGGVAVAGGNITGSANSSSYSVAGGGSYSNGGAIQFFGSAAAGSPGTLQFLTGTGATNAIVGSFNASGTFNVVNNATVGGTLGVTGAATFSNSVSASSFSGAGTGLTGTAGSLSIGGNAATATTATNLSGGSVNGTTGTFSGAVSGTTGTFSGALSGASVTGSMVANAATTLTGTSTNQLMTPGGFAGSSSIAANGYYKLPGGLVIAWGTVNTAGAGTTTATWPYTFTTVYNVSATEIGTGGGAASGPAVYNIGTNQCQFVVNPGASVTAVHYIVIGI